MADWVVLLFLALVAVVLVGATFAAIAIVMIRNLSRRVETLERERAPSSTLRSASAERPAGAAVVGSAYEARAQATPSVGTREPAPASEAPSTAPRAPLHVGKKPGAFAGEPLAAPQPTTPAAPLREAASVSEELTRAAPIAGGLERSDASKDASAPVAREPSGTPSPIPTRAPDRGEWASPPRTLEPAGVQTAGSAAAPGTGTSSGGHGARPPTGSFADSSQRFEWERWLGVRGAAVVGGIVLAIAGFLLVQYSIERQWITPERRVILAALFGLACFVASFPLRKRGYRIVADSITGAAAVLLYAASWSAHVLYGMIGFGAAFAAMVTVTAGCAFVAHKYASLVTAVLGLVGGFATPIVLSSGQDRPIALFGYVLLLDLAFLFVAQKQRWASLALVALAGTFILQALWIFLRVDHASLPLALIILAVFALFFAGLVARQAAAERARFAVAQLGALILPFVFALYFAQDRVLGEHVWPMMVLASVLAVASAWIARSGELVWLPFGSAAGAVALAMTWTANRVFAFDRDAALELVACATGLTVLHAVLAEIASRSSNTPRAESARGAVFVTALGFQLVMLFAASRPIEVGPWPWLVSTTLFALILFRSVAIGERPVFAFASSAIAGATVFTWAATHADDLVRPAPLVLCAALVLIACALSLAAWLVRARGVQWGWYAVTAFTAPATLGLLAMRSAPSEQAWLWTAAAGVLAVQSAVAAAAARSSLQFAVTAIVATLALMAGGHDPRRLAPTADFGPIFACILIFGFTLALWPVLHTKPWIDRAGAWRIAVISVVPLFVLVRGLFIARWNMAPIFLLPLAFELAVGAAAIRLYATRADEDRARRVGRIWYSCAAILFAAAIVPMQIDRESLSITLALFAAGVALFHVRIDAKPLAWVAFAALLVSFLMLVVVGSLKDWPHSSMRVLNWVAYTHLLPSVAAIVTTICLRRAGAPAAAGFSGILAILFVFTWINLEIANAFSNAEYFTLRYEHTPTRDLTASLAWLAYAIVLLLLGVSKQRGGLRWASLILLMLTIGKVFLFDLSHLEGLYRAASVAGLGLSLLLVSVLYQRFVFRRPASSS